MNILYKAIIAAGLLCFLCACTYDPVTGGYDSASNNYYWQAYNRQSPNYGYPSSGYSGYQQSPYGYSGNQQRPYCPDDDDN